MFKTISDIEWEDIYKIWKELLEEKSIDLFSLLDIKDFYFDELRTSLVEYYTPFWIKKEDVEDVVKTATKEGLGVYCNFYLKGQTRGEYDMIILLQNEENNLEMLSALLLIGVCRGIQIFYNTEYSLIKRINSKIQSCAGHFIYSSIGYKFHYKSNDLVPTILCLDNENCKYLDLNNTDINYWLEELLKILLDETISVLNEYCICNFRNFKEKQL